MLYIIHLYSWIASVAFQVTTPSFKVADPQQARPDFGAEVVYWSVCDDHHLSTCLTLTNIKKTNGKLGQNVALNLVGPRKDDALTLETCATFHSSSTIKSTF